MTQFIEARKHSIQDQNKVQNQGPKALMKDGFQP